MSVTLYKSSSQVPPVFTPASDLGHYYKTMGAGSQLNDSGVVENSRAPQYEQRRHARAVGGGGREHTGVGGVEGWQNDGLGIDRDQDRDKESGSAISGRKDGGSDGRHAIPHVRIRK
ncbi:hypothetical protein HDU84_006943 [Entophlyctis sp. JEL0112]|nr:hypothetical protein HDU84_006943 [Entophlyctis sp. JEL0112]